MTLVLGTFLNFNFLQEGYFTRKTREIIQNKTNQVTFKRIKRNSRLLKMKIFCGVLF